MANFKMTRDRMLGLLSVLAGIAVLISSLSIKSRMQLNEPGPALFPRICGCGFVLFGAIILLRKPKADEKPFMTKDGWIRVVQLYLILMAYVFIGLTYVGYLISTPILLFVLYMVLAEADKKPKVWFAAVLALGIGLFLYLFFRRLIGVPLPQGVILPALGIRL